MVVLGYAQARPHLRVLRLPDETVEPSPVRLDAARNALDGAVKRSGWVAVLPNEEQWAVSLPLAGRAQRFGRWWDCVPSLDPRRVWCAAEVHEDDWKGRPSTPTRAVEYDGVERRIVRELALPPGSRLHAHVPAGLVFTGEHEQALQFWDIEQQRASRLVGTVDLVASCEATLAVLFPKQLVLFDTGTGQQRRVHKPLPGGWERYNASFSPDGTRLALAIRAEPDPPPDDIGAAIARLHQPRWTRLALIDVATAKAHLVDGRFDNFASTPVWSNDGRWLLFDAPFDKSLFACDTHAVTPTLLPFLRRRGRISPLVDITD
jgi:hypothetical protein